MACFYCDSVGLDASGVVVEKVLTTKRDPMKGKGKTAAGWTDQSASGKTLKDAEGNRYFVPVEGFDFEAHAARKSPAREPRFYRFVRVENGELVETSRKEVKQGKPPAYATHVNPATGVDGGEDGDFFILVDENGVVEGLKVREAAQAAEKAAKAAAKAAEKAASEAEKNAKAEAAESVMVATVTASGETEVIGSESAPETVIAETEVSAEGLEAPAV